MKLPPAVLRRAEISLCGQFRYQLLYVWKHGLPVLPWGLLNPSVADRTRDDPTFRRVGRFTERIGNYLGIEYGGFVIFNAYAYRATKPKALRDAGWPVGPENNRWILDSCALGDNERRVICGWGGNARGMERPQRVLELLRAHDYKPMALRLTEEKLPWHPLMLSYEYSKPFLI